MFNHAYSDEQFVLYILHVVLQVQSTLLTAYPCPTEDLMTADPSQNLSKAPIFRRLFSYRSRKGVQPRNAVLAFRNRYRDDGIC